MSSCKPQAVIVVDANQGCSVVVNFDASGSRDMGKDIREYSWDFDNDGTVDASGVKVGHTFNNPGEYTVKLVVRDAGNRTSEAFKTITAREVILRAKIMAGTAACVSTPVTFDASASFDKDNDIIGYEWDFDNDGVVDAYGINASHSFSEKEHIR
jgi:PKD repeat protein